MAQFRPGRRFSPEELMQAKSASTVDVIHQVTGFDFVKKGREWKCREHDSLCVFADGKGWKWYSRDIQGSNAIDFLVKAEGYQFQDAVTEIIGDRKMGTPSKYISAHTSVAQHPDKKELRLPEHAPNDSYERVFAYLAKTRCIEPAVIYKCIEQGLLYQDVKGNCVFVGREKGTGTPKYAALRGTCTIEGVPAFKGECAGSDKSYGFLIGAPESNVYVFESAIDAMSHASLVIHKARQRNVDENVWQKYPRLSLGGVSDRALERFLKENSQITTISFCLDNDEAGKNAAKLYAEKYEAQGYKVNIYTAPSAIAKDYNEYLCAYKQQFKSGKSVALNNNLSKGRK